MSSNITAAELAKRLPDVLSRVAEHGETFIIEYDGHPVATLAPAAPPRLLTVQEVAERLRDLPAVDPQFAGDLEEIMRSRQTMKCPW